MDSACTVHAVQHDAFVCKTMSETDLPETFEMAISPSSKCSNEKLFKFYLEKAIFRLLQLAQAMGSREGEDDGYVVTRDD